jgi:6,7-dimethyl-8-ribityllumazine synthase
MAEDSAAPEEGSDGATHRLGPVRQAGSGNEIVGSHDGSGLTIAVACGRFNDEITTRLLDGALSRLAECGVSEERRVVVWVPGSFELPLTAQALAASGRVDAVVCLGAVVRGETAHFDFVAGECAAGLQRVQLDTGIPCVFGVLTTETWEQALERSGGSVGNKGAESVETAIEMVHVLRRVLAVGEEAAGARAPALEAAG